MTFHNRNKKILKFSKVMAGNLWAHFINVDILRHFYSSFYVFLRADYDQYDAKHYLVYDD